jgi:aconitate hydratase
MRTTKTNSVKSIDRVYDAVPAVARAYKAAGVASIVVGDHNYGEGSSRSMLLWNLVSLGKTVLVKSFARIHETNLKNKDC